jgi:hypothetical protein
MAETEVARKKKRTKRPKRRDIFAFGQKFLVFMDFKGGGATE